MEAKKRNAAAKAPDILPADEDTGKSAKEAPQESDAGGLGEREVKYTIDEFAAATVLFSDHGEKVSTDIVRAALRFAGKDEATVEEAMETVKAFRERKVK